MVTQDGWHTGLYVGFEGYRSATDDELAQAAQDWLVVLDTNVLLGLYNYQGSSLDDFIKVFEALGDRLFVPHQVLDEFWRSRSVVLSENQGRHREQEIVRKAFDELDSAFARWHQRVVDRTNPPPAEVQRELDEARTVVLDYMKRMNAEAAVILPGTPTQEDRVLGKLEPILNGRVGPSPAVENLDSLRAEGRSRVASKTPPGYMDSEKNPERAVGDFLVWRQAMEASRDRALPILFVTQDQKEDWWADRGGQSMRARPELVQELLRFSGHRLLMIRSQDLVRLGSHLGVDVSQSTLDEAELASEEVVDWTPDVISAYLDVLAHWPESYQILQEAAYKGGEISRAEMAEILGRDPDASMKGMGNPYYTAMKRLMEQGLLEAELQVPLFAYYENAGGFMSHFLMPEELVAPFSAQLESRALASE